MGRVQTGRPRLPSLEATVRVERARAEEEEALREMEASKRARDKAKLPRQPTATVAAATEHSKFSATAYVPPTPHLFVPSGFTAYRPRRIDYEAEVVLRDPTTHISTTWTEEGCMERQRRVETCVKWGLGVLVVGGPPELSWKMAVIDAQGDVAEIYLTPARAEPAPVTVLVRF
ncbi:hypothetical protein RHMOL_Rhmol05G0139500 [Rhododendron molle]|uniref:Uncharacterized protein n=1 Tax=Rhododendron molle TaxID=49168 RepID=A0ACC0NP21_RHOML|nr:hypothetical protein RHMOL_Rhmol05G0139500 [Rhododendron molle]